MLDENYYQIAGWMLNRLGLKGVQLNVYAIIYGFTQDGETEFQGSLQYLCDACGASSKKTIMNALKELVDKGYILKSEETINHIKYVKYRVSLPMVKNTMGMVKNTMGGMVKNTMGDSNNYHGGMVNFTTNNNNHNNNHNDINNTVENIKKEFDELWKMYPNKTGKRIAYQSYGKARIRNESPCTFEQVKKGIENYCSKVVNIDPKYVKRGDNYFKGECWNDEYSENPSATTTVEDPEVEKYKCLINKF